MKDQKLTDAEKDLMEIIWQKKAAFMRCCSSYFSSGNQF
jgi:predicted transcriptional regulator